MINNKRLLFLLMLICGLLIVFCVFTAVSLVQQQATISDLLRENIASRRAATELEECIVDIVALLKDRIESVGPLHERAKIHLRQAREYADQPEELVLLDQLEESFEAYVTHWHQMPRVGEPGHATAVREALEILELNLQKPCEELIQYNAGQIEIVVEEHERLLRNLAGGIAAVSGLGGVAGLVLGLGVARSWTQSMRRLSIQIQDATGLLENKPTAIVLTGEGNTSDLHAQMETLKHSVEAIMERLGQREREVLRADQFAAVGQLATGVAHEIRNPLTSIKLLVQAGLEDEGSANLSAEDLRVIEQEIRRMETTLRSFLEFARPPRMERRPTDLISLIRSVLTLVRGRAENQKVAIHLKLPTTEKWVLTLDSEQVKQVLINIVLNALDAMPHGGTLTFTGESPPQGGASIRISDTGQGISPELMNRLFQPFVTGKKTGLGLGLVISRRIVEEHGGTIATESLAGGGAAFTVTFPASANTILESR